MTSAAIIRPDFIRFADALGRPDEVMVVRKVQLYRTTGLPVQPIVALCFASQQRPAGSDPFIVSVQYNIKEKAWDCITEYNDKRSLDVSTGTLQDALAVFEQILDRVELPPVPEQIVEAD